MKKNFYSLIFAQNYVTYHSSMYSEFFKKSNKKSIVIYEDPSGKSERIEKRWNSKINWGIDLTKGFKSLLIKNYSANSYSAGFFSRANYQIPFIINKVRPKKIFFQGYADLSSWLILISSFLFRIKSINWKGERTLKKGEKISFLKKTILKIFFFNFCHKIFYSCGGNLKYLNQFNLNKDKLFPMNCSVNNKFFRENYKKNKLNKDYIKKKMNISKKAKVIIVVSNFEKRKNIKALLNILPFIRDKNIQLLIVGNGNYKMDIEKSHNIFRDRIKLSGFIDINKISEYYTISDLFVLLSEYDPSPKTLNEALNFGLPCIVSRELGTSSDLIKDGVNGFVLNSSNKYKVLKYIDRVFSDTLIKDKCLIFNKNKLKHYSPEQNADALFPEKRFSDINK